MKQNYPHSVTGPPVPLLSPQTDAQQLTIASNPAHPPRVNVLLILIGTVLSVPAFIALWGAYESPSIDYGMTHIRQGLGGDAAGTPYTNSKYGISLLLPGLTLQENGYSATVPGYAWEMPQKLSVGNSESTWREDHKAHWGFSLRPSSVRGPSELVNFLRANPLVIDNSGETVSHVTFAGYQAIKLETTVDCQGDGLWREVYYAFVANHITYLIEGGTTVDEWSKGGKIAIASLLDSVTIDPEAVVLDPTPAP